MHIVSSSRGRRRLEKLVLAIFISAECAAPFLGASSHEEAMAYARAAQQHDAYLYFFTASDIDLRRPSIWGWSWVDGDWIYSQQPWPHLVYDQAQDLARTERQKVRRVRRSKKLVWLTAKQGLPKWLTHQIIAADRQLAALLPEAQLIKEANDLAGIARRHKAVLVKPNYGSQGKGICRLWHRQDGTYGLQYSEGKRSRVGLSLRQAYRRIVRYARTQRLVAEQQIALLRVGNSLTDMRIHMGRDRQGNWLPLQTHMRIGKEGFFVTNWSRGAQEVHLLEGLAMAGLNANQMRQLLAQIYATSVRVAQVLEAGRGRMVEIGLDLALDIELQLWFIEANSLPGKYIDDQESNLIPPHYASVIDYAVYLAHERAVV